jgi:8-oxo-dGTP diphosphatase
MPEQNQINIGVGAVVFRGGDVLLIKRGKPPFMGEWSIPGGGLHFCEALEDAVRREVMEETAVEITALKLLGVFETLPGISEPAFERHTVMVDYLAEWTAGEPAAGDDAAAAAFVPLEEAIQRVSWDQTRGALRLAATLRNGAENRLQSGTR